MRRSAWISIFGALAAQVAISSTAEAGPNDAILVGVVKDVSTGEAIEGAVVVVRGEKLQGERTQTTNVSGLYRIPNLTPGENYEITVLHKGYGAGQKRSGLSLRASATLRVDVYMTATGNDKEVINVTVPAPTVDVGAASIGLSVDKEMARRVPIALPTGKGGANRSFEAVAEATPGARNDTYGTSVAGTTSPENKYYVDGMSVNDPAFGLNGAGLSVEFVEEVRVEAGGYLPEYGRATGGIVNAVTKSGSNEFHGSVYANYTPGQLFGRNQVPVREGSSVVTDRNLGWIGDVGFDVGGRIVKDKLWFYAGANIARTVYNLDTRWNRKLYQPSGMGSDPYLRDMDGNPIPLTDPITGYSTVERIAGTEERRKAQATQIQVLGKLTYSPKKNHTLELLGIYMPTLSGGNGTFSMNQATALPEVGTVAGSYNALASKSRDSNADLNLTWKATADDNKWNFDTFLGWHHQNNFSLPVDGSRVGSTSGLAGEPGMIYRQNNPNFHDLSDAKLGAFNQMTPDGICGYINNSLDASVRAPICPVSGWTTGGAGFIYERKGDRIQARSIATRILYGAGTHTLKFGIDFEYMSYNSNRGYSGGTLYREGTNGQTISDFRQYAFLTGPGQGGHPQQPAVARLLDDDRRLHPGLVGDRRQGDPQRRPPLRRAAPVRRRRQAGDGPAEPALAARRPDLGPDAERTVEAVRQLRQVLPERAAQPGGPRRLGRARLAVDPRGQHAAGGQCLRSDQPERERGLPGRRRPDHPRRLEHQRPAVGPDGRRQGGGRSEVEGPVDRRDRGSAREYEIIRDARLGLTYSHRWMTRTIEDMSRDEATTYFIGNPGYGIARDFPKAQRVYDAVMLYVDKKFTRNFLMNASYTLAFNRGNISGLFRPESGQLDPNINSTFDLVSLLVNQYGYLPGDTSHAIKLFTAGEIPLPKGHSITARRVVPGQLRRADQRPRVARPVRRQRGLPDRARHRPASPVAVPYRHQLRLPEAAVQGPGDPLHGDGVQRRQLPAGRRHRRELHGGRREAGRGPLAGGAAEPQEH
jgi:hypothetical protein